MKNIIASIIQKLKFKFPYSVEEYFEDLYVENYHCHKDFSNTSTADCAESIQNYAEQTIEYKGKCLFSGDHGNQGNQFEVYKTAEKYNLKYRHSVEAYWVKDRLKEYPEIDKETGEYKKDTKTGEIKTQKDRANCHICLIAKNSEGREDINYILSIANEDGYYYKPRIDLDLLFSVPKDNIIVTSACFEKDTKVLTKNKTKNIQDVKSGDLVLTHEGTWEKVIVPTKREYKGEMYNLSIEGCFENIKCTKDHKFPTITKTHSDVTKQIIWKRAEELNTNDRILSAIDKTIELMDYIDVDLILENYRENCNMGRPLKSPIIKSKIEVDALFLQVLGLYTAEGNINNRNNYICFTLNKKETNLFNIINEFSLRYLNKPAVTQDKKGTNGMSVLIHSKEMSLLFLYLIPSGVANKKIPNFVLRLQPDLQMEFIKGLFLGDGHITKNLNRINYGTVSEQLGYEVGYILERNGLKSCCSTRSEKIDKNNVHHRKSYIVEVNSKEFYIYWKSYIKSNVKYDYKPHGWNSKIPVNIDGTNYIHRRVRQIETYEYNDYVYCLSVENTPSFRVEGISVHNCIAGWKYEDAEEIWLKIHNYFGDNFFLELQNHDTDTQKILNKKILELSRKHNIQIICGLDSHYVKIENSIKRDQILKYKGIHYEDEQGWHLDFPNGKEIFSRFKKQGILNDEEILTSMMNTNIFVNECEEIIFDKKFKIPSVYPKALYEDKVKIFKQIINENYKKEKLKSSEKIQGIQYEVGEYVDSGVIDYPLTNYHIIKKAVNEKGGILTTTSRGSAASFITNKLLGFTTIDRFNCEIPIYPERFLTKERVLSGQMPDVDFNCAIADPFVEATKELIGEHSCYPLMAIEKLKEKAAWQLYAGANDVIPETANEISKFIDKYNEKMKYADEEDKEFINIEDFIPEEYMEIYKGSLEYQGITINLKCHPCGFIILEGDIRRKIGLISAVSETTGKRTLCACIEGNYLDEFGYVKNDYLIVDSVHLTYKFFQSIGRDVPSFDELREMINNDQATWDIYRSGITCCVNQVEKESTTKKAKQYKCTNLAESSAFIAAIRPGFKTLLGTFLAREKYTTGEDAIDKILEDSYNFMLYQESIMKLLSYLGLSMGEAYGVLKAISKKKLKGEQLENLQQTLKANWIKIIGNLDNFEKIWNVIEDSARYAFNSPHALSMGGDSAYQAWFKAHHTAKFYEVAINHYQDKEKKKKIDALIKEALIFYEYKLGNYEFGKDNRRVNLDEQNKIIYPNLSSVKGFGENVSNTLFELGQNNYNNFSEVLEALNGTKINKTVIEKLVKLNYFKQFGEVNYLLEIIKWTDIFKDAKTISIKKLDELGLSYDYIITYGYINPKNKDAKQITKLQSDLLLEDIIKNIKYEPLTINEIIKNQKDILGIITYYDNKYSPETYYVSGLEVMKSIVKATVYRIQTGESIDIKMWTNIFNKNMFKQGDFLYIKNIEEKPQKEPTGEINKETGKKIYRDIEGMFESWISKYQNITYKFEGEKL
jgi:DNA polymerase III alpha subunit